MSCGSLAGLATLAMRAMRASSNCAAIACDPNAPVGDFPECGARGAIADLFSIAADSGLISTSPASLGDVAEIDCEAADLNTLFCECLRRASIDGRKTLVTWEHGEPVDCGGDCDETATLEQLLRGCFIRMSNLELRVRVLPVDSMPLLQCGAEHWQALLRRAIAKVGPSSYAIRVIYEA